MSRRRIQMVYGHPQTMVIRVQHPYTLVRFLFDCFMVAITSGLWLIWIFVREMRKK